MEVRNVDRLIQSLGEPGKIQILVLILLSCNLILVICNHMAMVFYAAKTKHHCKLAKGSLVKDLIPVVIKNNEERLDGCRFYSGNNTTETTRCNNGWTYVLEDGEATIISEFDLVCDDAYKSDLATTMYFCGVLLSGLLFGHLADKFGRKPVVAFSLIASGVVGIGIFAFRIYIAFVILRFFMGFLMQGLMNSTFILTIELFSTKWRVYAAIGSFIFENFGLLLLDLLAYLIRNWKYIQLSIVLLTFLQMLSLFFVPESLRWLLTHHHYSRAERMINKTTKFNKLPFPRKLFDEIKQESMEKSTLPTEKRKANFLDVLRSPQLRRNTFILVTIWFTVSASYYGLAFNISFLSGDKYFNFAISTLLDIIGSLAMLWIVPRYGRRRPLSTAFVCSAVANCTCAIIMSKEVPISTAVKFLGTAMAILGKMAIACTFPVIFVFTSELYPTVVRNISLGVNTLWTRIGGMAAPQIFFLSTFTYPFVPYSILALLLLSSAAIILLLPETNNKALSDKIEVSVDRPLCPNIFDTQEKDDLNVGQTFHQYETSI